ncbi:unnamed protein product [Mytilus coruscus]|uniref:Reverse transcriptase domain-containing protein n=1 Tax=Mytilus coruscus TaxID=42192 RepID=A0A6J8DDP6_MYTCO|nr:unnamed protein product [Mytilus coruscus]
MKCVRQGGVLSTHLYKAYINELLLDLQKRNLGSHIGNNYVGCPTCADDIVLLSLNREEMQEMLNIVDNYSKDHRFNIHPQKSNVIIKTGNKRKDPVDSDAFKMGNNDLNCSDRTSHLGLTRSTKDETRINVDDRISLARRTLYSLIKTGVHGSNGLNPKSSYRIYQAYVLPRLLYGLETLHVNSKEMSLLSSFHLDILRKLQSLPKRTACASVYLLLGALQLNAVIHKRQLSLLFGVLNSNNETIRSLVMRQYMSGRSTGFLQNSRNFRDNGKKLTKSAINEHWTNKLRLECEEKSTLQNLAISNLGIGVTHPVWATVSSSVSDIRKAITKSRMLTGTYLLQAHRHRFNQAEVDPFCPNCRTETEDLCHVLTTFPLYMNIRMALYTPIKNFILSIISETKWATHFSNRDAICTLIVDCQNFANLDIIPNNPGKLGKIENMSRIYCYEIHKKRLSAEI